jgi:hypothetical protein
MWGVRLLDFIFAAIASLVFFKSVRSLTTWQVGAWATFGLYYWIAESGWFFTAAPDPWVSFLCVAAIAPWLAPNETPSTGRTVSSGFLVACAGLIKPLYLVVGIAPLLSILLAQGVMRRRRALLLFTLAIGATIPIVLFCAYFAWHGGLSRAIEVHILYPFSTYAALKPGGRTVVTGFAEFLGKPATALSLPFVALGILAIRRQPQILWPTLGWLAATVFAVVAQGKYFPQHWFPVYAPLVLLAALGVHKLASSNGNASLFVAVAASLTFTTVVCVPPFYDVAKSIYYLAVKRSPDSYYSSFHYFGYNAEDERTAATYIKAHTKPDDGVFVWGNDATVGYLAERPNPSRFTFEMPLSLSGPYLEPYRAQAMRELCNHPPVYFVVGLNWAWFMGASKEQALANFPQMATFLSQNYSLEKSFGVLDVYRNRLAPEANAAKQ